MKKYASFFLVVIVALNLAGCGGGGTTGGNTNDPNTLYVIENYDPRTFRPGNTDEQAYNRIVRQIYETLFMMTPEGKVTPWLATGYKWETPTRMIVTLRNDVKFSDGSPFTAEDVAWTINFAKEKSLPISQYNLIAKVDVVDPYTVAIILKGPNQTMPAHLASSMCVIGSKKAFESGKGDYLGASAIGTGPYKLVKYTPGDMINFTANEHYWRKGEPKVKNMQMRIVTSSESGATEAKTKKNDIVVGANTRQFPAIRAIDGLNVITHQSANTVYLLMNTAAPALSNPKVREAFARAINVKDTVKLCYGDFGQPASAMISPNILGRNEDTFKKYYGAAQDIKMAKALLAEAGHPNGIELEITVENNDAQRGDMAEALQAQVLPAGIKLKVNKMESATMRDYLAKGKQQISIYGFTCRTLEADGFLAQLQPGSSALARIGYKNEAFFKKYSEGAAIQDRAARGKVWEECVEMLMKDYTMIPVWHKALGAVVKNNVKGFYWATDYEQVYYQFISK